MDQNEHPKPWEKPWTPDDLRRNSTCWSLAGDAGLLRYLQEFSQNLVAKTHTTQKMLDELVEDLNTTSSAVNNVTNSFLSLANTQFVENRVDDDDEETKVTADSTVPLQKTPSKAEVEAETVDMVREALTIGMSIMDTMFETIEVPAVSDSEEDESSASMGRIILRPVNPYANRPLPFLIGSREFYEDDRVGLADVFSDEEESGVPGATEIPSSESASDVEADYAISDRMKRRRIPSVSGSENSEPESEQLNPPMSHHPKQQHVAPPPSDMFGEENSHKVPDEQPPSGVGRLPNNFAAELAARLGVVPETEQQTAPQKATLTQAQQKDVGNMFLPPLEDNDDDGNENDVLFGKNAKYSAGSGLFDDLGDWNQKSTEPESLWDEPESKKNQKTNAESDFKPTAKGEEATFAQSKADDLFGNDLEKDLFSTTASPTVNKPSVANMPAGGQKSVPVIDTRNVQPKVEKSAPLLSETSGLFDDLWDASDFDYNSTSNTVQSTVPKEAGLFAPADEKKNVKENAIAKESIAQVAPVKKPVGGVSVLGNMSVTASQLISRLPSSVKESGNNDTVAKKITENKPETNHNTHPRERSDSPVNPPSVSKLIQQKKPQSLFDDDNDSDEDNLLFSSASSTGSRSRRSIDVLSSEKKIDYSSEEPPKKTSLFGNGSSILIPSPDDTNTDLFSVKTSGLTLGASDGQNSSVSHENVPTGGLFDDWEDDIQSTESRKGDSPALIPVDQSDNKGMAKEINHVSKSDSHSKGSSLFDKESDNTSIFSEDVTNNFVISGNASKNDIFSEIGNEVKPYVTQRQNSKVNLFSGDDFDEEIDIFGEKLRSDKSENVVGEKVTSLPDKKTDPVFVMTAEPPVFPDESTDSIFSVPADRTPGKEKSVVKDTTETENTEAAPATHRNTYDTKKPAVTKKPVVSLGKPKTATRPVDKDVEESTSEISVQSAAGVSQLTPDVNGMHNHKKQTEIGKEHVDSEIYSKKSDKKDVIAPVTKPKPPKTLDIRKTTALQQDSSTGEDTFGESSPGIGEESFGDSQKTERLSSTAFGELLKGYSPPDDKIDGLLFSREKQLSEKKREPAEEVVTSPKSGEKLPGKIQRPSLNIDPLALLPGAKPPRKGFQSEEGIGFDQPASDITAPLHSAGKERVKIQVKRRPQSRHARHEALRASAVISQDNMAEETVPSPASAIQQPDKHGVQGSSVEPKSKNTEADQYEAPTKMSATPNPPAAGSSLLSPSTDEEDMFGVPSDLPSDYSDGNDLFRAAPILSPTEVPQFSQKAGLPVESVVSDSSQTTSGPLADLFISSSVDRENSFFPAPTPKSVSGKSTLTENHDTHCEIIQSTVVDTGENDLFQATNAEAPPRTLFPDARKGTAAEKDVEKSMKINKLQDLFSSVEEDLFPSAKSDNCSDAAQTDLFGNNSVPVLSSDGGLFSSSLWTSEETGRMSSTVKITENVRKDRIGTQLTTEGDSINDSQSDHIAVSSEKISSEKSIDSVPKIPAGGLSVLNDDGSDHLFSASSKKDARTSRKHSNGKVKEKSIKIRTGENSSLFGDDSPETDDLFSSMPHSLEKKTVSSKTPVSVTESKGSGTKQALSKGGKSLFEDDEEEDLFGRTTAKPSVSSSSRVLPSLDPLGRDELFGTTSVVPNKTQRMPAEASGGRKKEKTVVFDDPLMALSKSGDTSP
ncbi:WASH complex subunit 2 [Schistocerca serialis cubense]|uniref:WASH complex subunit 2 n=1 Tax=Schistocerca serialis cubense TaxID=2023355 RepID=UPI00214ED64D|nr:WASH complex subunit 2 [Schistocerca serialis cubense]